MRVFLWVAVLLLAVSCGCSSSRFQGKRIGVDPSWSPLDFHEMQPYVNGYTDDVLQEFAAQSGIKFEKVAAGWGELMEGLKRGSFDAVLTSLPPYPFNEAKYDFSRSFLELGSVLVSSPGSKYRELKQLSGKLVGLVKGDPAVLAVQVYPEILIRVYGATPELLDGVVQGEIDAAVLDQLSAFTYANGVFAGQIQISSTPLTNSGLRLVALKGKATDLIKGFDKTLKKSNRKKILKLQQKWRLAADH